MTKRIAVGSHYRKGLLLPTKWVNGVGSEPKLFGPGELIPEAAVIPRRYFRDKRVVWIEDAPVKKARPKPTPKLEKAEKSASLSPTSEGAGASAPAPLEVTEEKSDTSKSEKKTKRKRKKLFGSE